MWETPWDSYFFSFFFFFSRRSAKSNLIFLTTTHLKIRSLMDPSLSSVDEVYKNSIFQNSPLNNDIL